MVLDELVAYVGFDEVDRARLAALEPKLAPHYPAIAARFYDAVFANPGAAAVLSGPAQVERLRVTLIEWMGSGLSGPYDEAFYEKRSRIGRRHVAIGLAQHYMFTAVNVVRAAYLDRIAELYPAAEALLVVRSVDKLFDIELALMLRSYQLDSEDKLVTRERRIQADRFAALQTLSTGIAHEVRNPLNSARLQLELLDRRIRKTTDDPKLLEPTANANAEILRLGGLLDNFVRFAGAPEARMGTADLVAIAREVIAELADPRIVLAGDPTAPAIVDAVQVHQIMANLVRNALDATSTTVEVTVTIEDGHARIRVSDDGAGMSDDVRTRIYEPFFTTKETAVGLGLAVVWNYVALHDGRIDVTTGPAGTHVDVKLPTSSSGRRAP